MLNPLFLFFLAILVVRALVSPLGNFAEIAPSGAYASHAFSTGLLEGYNTMDALAGLAFGIVVVEAIRGLGVKEPGQVAKRTVYAGIFSSLLMALIYVLVTVVGAQSRGMFDVCLLYTSTWSKRSASRRAWDASYPVDRDDARAVRFLRRMPCNWAKGYRCPKIKNFLLRLANGLYRMESTRGEQERLLPRVSGDLGLFWIGNLGKYDI